MTDLKTESKSALILVEYQNDWLAPTGSINPQFQDREQIDIAIVNSAKVLAEARRRTMEVIHVIMVLEPTYRMLGKAKYGLRACPHTALFSASRRISSPALSLAPRSM